MSNVVIDIAAQFTGAKAFKQAETSSMKLERSVKKLGKQLVAVFAVRKVVAYGKAAANAFAEDDRAARSLAKTLANTGNAFEALGVEKFIADTQRATGVLDDELRPAFQQLVTVTGNVAKSQEALNLALDISAGTGKSLSAVSAALSKGYAGNTTALSRLGAGLSKATLKSNDMEAITAELTDKFAGQASTAANGYSGQIARLNVALKNSSEIIGKDLLDSIDLISGAGGIGKATSSIEGLATSIGNAIFGVSALINRLKGIYKDTFIGDVFGLVGKIPNLASYGASQRERLAGNPSQSPGQRAAIDKQNIKLAKEKNTLSAIDNANTSRKLVLTADQLALQELQKKFDLDRIQIQAALNNTTDAETKARLNGLMVIQDNNSALAKKALAELNAAQAAEEFARRMRNNYDQLDALNAKIAAKLAANALDDLSLKMMSATKQPTPIYQPIVDPSSPYYFLSTEASTEAARSAVGAQTINITLDGQVFQNAVVGAVNQASASGTALSYTQTATR